MDNLKSSLTGGVLSFLASITWLEFAKELIIAFLFGLVGSAGGYVFSLLVKYIKNKYGKTTDKS